MAGDVYRGTIFVEAPRAEVFRHFTEPEALASWMGDVAEIDPRPGGRFLLRFEDREVEGRYVEVTFPERLVITWGRRGADRLPPGASTLTVTLAETHGGTWVTVEHDGLPDIERELHAAGWSHYLPRLRDRASGRTVAPHHVPEHLVARDD